MPDKITQVYNAYKADGATKAQSEQQFRNWMVGDNYRRGVYNDLVKQGANVGTFEHFTQALGYKMNPKPKSKAAQQAVAYKAPQVPEGWGDLDTSNVQTPWMKRHYPNHGTEEVVPAHGAKRPKKKPVTNINMATWTPVDTGAKVTGQEAVTPVYREKKEGKYWNPITETEMGDNAVLDWSTVDENGDKVANVDKKQNFEADAAMKALVRSYSSAKHRDAFGKFNDEFDKLLAKEKELDSTPKTSWNDFFNMPTISEAKGKVKLFGTDDTPYQNVYNKYGPKLTTGEEYNAFLAEHASEIADIAHKMHMTLEGFVNQYVAPNFQKIDEEEYRKAAKEYFKPKNAGDIIDQGLLTSTEANALGITPKAYQDLRNEAVADYEDENSKIVDDKGVFSGEGIKALGKNVLSGAAQATPTVVGFALGGSEAKGTMAALNGGWKLLRGSGIATKLLGKAAPTLANLTKKYGTETAARMLQAAGNESVGSFIKAGTRQFGQGALTMGFFEGNNYLATEGREKLKEGKVGEAIKGFYTHGMSGLGTGMLFGGISMATSFFGRGLGITGKELTKGEVLKHGAEKAAYSAVALFAEGLGFKAEELYDEAKRGDLTFGSVLENGGKGIIDKITMDIGMGAGKGKLPNLKRMLVGATHNTTGGVKFSTTEKNEILNSTGGKSLLEGLDEVGRQGKMPPMYKGATAFFSDPNVSRRTKQKVAYVLGKTIDTNIPRTERVSITQGEKGTQIVRTYSKDGELLSVDAYANKDKAEMAKQEVYMKRDRDDFLALWNDSIQPTQEENNAMFEEIVNRMGESDLGVFLAKLEDAKNNGDADFLSKYEKIRGEVISKFFGDKDKARLDIMRDVNAEYEVDIDKVLDKDPTLWKDNERDAVNELSNRLKNGFADKNDEAQNKAVAHQDGADLSEQTELEDSEKFTENAKTVNDRQASATAAWMEIVKNTPELEEWMKNNPDATVEEMRENFGDDVADAYMELSKAKSMKDGFIQNTSQKIEDAVQNQVAQARFTGTFDGEKSGLIYIYTDRDGNEYTLVGGDLVWDAERGTYKVGDNSLAIFRDKDGNLVQKSSLEGLRPTDRLSVEDYANRIRTTLQEQKTAEIQSTETPLPEQPKVEPTKEPTEQPKVEPTKTAPEETETNNEESNEDETPKFKDGTPIPMTKDSKGRPTADYGKMTPAQVAEYTTKTFGDNAGKVIDAKIKKADKAVKDANKIKVDYSADDADILEAEAKKKTAIEAAERELALYTKAKAEMNKKTAEENAGGGQTGNRYEQWRKDGYHIGEGNVRYDRQKEEDQTGVYGRDVTVDFTPTVSVKGKAKVVEADSVQASHKNGQVNPLHFGQDWQPKDRTDDASYTAQNKALNNFDAEKITGDGNAFIGSSPSVNMRHEVIQGNNRAEILRRLYDEKPEEAAKYKQWLIDHAAEFGLDAAEIAKMKKPILVNELPVDDAKAKELGQYKASDFESGGKELPQTGAVINKLGDKVENVASILMRQGELPDDAKLSDLIIQNADKVLDFLSKNGFISATEEQTLRRDRGQLTIWLKDLLKHGLFEGDKVTEAAFSRMPDNAKKAVLATYLRDAKSPEDARIKANLQRSFEAYARLMGIPEFANAKNLKDARAAVQAIIEKENNSLFGEAPVREEFSTFELDLAALYKGLKDQKTLAGLFNKYFDAVQGDKATNRQLELGETPREAISKEDAIKEVFASYDTKPAETQRQVDEAVKNIATEITKQTGVPVVTDEKMGQSTLEDAEATDSDVKYHKETDKDTLDALNNGETIKVYRAMQVIDGKLYPPMAAAVDGKRVEANELGTWIRADENPDLAIPDVDPKTGKQKVDPKTGELKWKFKLDKGGKDATGKKATNINAAYNPYWHTSRSPLNDQFKSAWIRPNIVVVECEVPVSELTSGYKAERAKDAVGEVDWKSGSVSGEVFKQTGRARKVILSRWCKPVRVLDDAEVAQRAKEFVGDAKVTIPENVLTPKQRIAFEKEGFKIGEPEKGVKKSEQIMEAMKAGLEIDNSLKETSLETVTPPTSRDNVSVVSSDAVAKIQNNLDATKEIYEKAPNKTRGFITDVSKALGLKQHEASQYGTFRTKDGREFTIRISNHNARISLFDKNGEQEGISIVISGLRNKGLLNDGNAHVVEVFYPKKALEHAEGKPLVDIIDSIKNTLETGVYEDKTGLGKKQEVNSVREFRGKDGEVYGFVVDGKIYLDTKKMKPETPLHEYTHLWTEVLKSKNPKEWENVKKLLDEVEGLKEEVQKLYPELKGDDLYDEMLAIYSGRGGTKKLEAEARRLAAEEGKTVTESAKAQGFIEKVKTALQKYWKGVADILHIHFTTAEEVADKVLADWAKGVKPGEEKEKTKNPVEKAAREYHKKKVDAARKAYQEAKASGDGSEIKRTRDELKKALDDKLKSEHVRFVDRRKAIAKEIGEEEAQKIDKPWSEMDGEERMATAEKNPLTEDEIRNQTSEENRDFIEDAIDYLNGNHGFAQQIAYLKIYDDVRNRHENVPRNSGTEDGTQLAATGDGSGEELGLESGRGSGGPAEPVDNGTGGETAPGERDGGENGEGGTNPPAGKQGDSQGEGETPGLGGLPAGNTKPEGSGTTGGTGDLGGRGRRGGSGGPSKPDAKRKPTAKQGTTWRNRTGAEIRQEATAAKAGLKAALAEMRKIGKGEVSISLVGLNSRQIEYVPELMKAVKRYGMSLIDQGIYKVKDWMNNIREGIYGDMKDIGFSDKDIDDFIKEMWNSKMSMDGETHTIAEWSAIYGNEQLRKKLATPLTEKRQMQMDAEPIKVKVGDRKNIEETLPFLLPQQQDDVLKAETQFFGNEHADREHAYGKGYMFTNGTGTGKTYTGLGIAKRLQKQGKGRILFVTPSQTKVKDWINDGRNLNLDIRDLDSVAKEKGTTATTESGEGMVITTYANFRQNKKLLEENWDAVIYDESHRIMENKKGTETAGSMQHYMVSNRDENHCYYRLREINEDYQKMRSAADKFEALRQEEEKRIQKEYADGHPSATERDVINATYKLLPKYLNSFVPADAAKFPKLGKVYHDYVEKSKYYYDSVEPKLKEQAKKEWKKTKVVFLSATPFNTRENLDYAEGYIFKYPERGADGIDGKTRFYLDHFGAAYKYRYHRLEKSTSNPDAVAKQEVAFSDYLQNTLCTMSGRIIDSPYDYSRDFPTVSPDHAERFNQAVEDAVRGKYLGRAYSKTIGDYNYGSALFETLKVANIIDRIKQHLDAGRKVVIFHRRVETKSPLQPPFAYMLDHADFMIGLMKPDSKEQKEAIQECEEFRKKYADLLQWEQTLDYSMPREQIAKVFGKDNVLFFSGKESKKEKNKAVDLFNDDNSGKNIIVIQEASGKEGISLHDTTGNHQRALITLGLPQSPITALQIEGRTYRIGNKSNAIFEYPILGLNSEMMLFGQKFNNQVSTTENLALGSQARNLRDSFANGILEHSGVVPVDQQGVGGKEFDAPKQGSTDPFDDAVLDYYSNQKLNSKNREGVDYFPTPEPLGYKMMQWAKVGDGDTILEPSAGHGAIARYAPKENQMTSIEPSQSLFTRLQLKAGGLGRKFLNDVFENYDIGNKHDVVVMNPPFGTAGATAIAHIDKAFKHLDEGGRLVAIIPRGATDRKFDKWIDGQKIAAMRAEVNLPDIVFKQAGTNVRCRVVVLDKITDPEMRNKAGYPEKIDLGGHYDKIEDFFNDLRDIDMPERIIDTQAKMQKKSRTTMRDIKEIKSVRGVTLNKDGIVVSMKWDRINYSINFQGSDNPQRWREKMGDAYDKYSQMEKTELNDDKQAVFGELKDLACKLAGMTEDEMRRYLTSKNSNSYNEGGVRFRKDEDKESSQNLYLSLQNKKGKDYYDTVTEIANRVAKGEARFAKLPEEYESRGVLSIPQAGARAIVSAWVRDNKRRGKSIWSSDGMLGASLTQLGKDGQETCLAKIEEWSRENGYWISEDSYTSKGYKSAHGDEARVYFVGDKVVKFVDSRRLHYKEGIIGYLDRITLLNAVAPDAVSRIIGFSRDKDGKFRVVLEQKKFAKTYEYELDANGDETENGTRQYNDWITNDAPKIKRQLARRGIKYDIDGAEATYKGEVLLTDLWIANIACDEKGRYHIIDAGAKLIKQDENTSDAPILVDNDTIKNSSTDGGIRFRKEDNTVTPREKEQQKRMEKHRATVQKATEKLNTKTTIHDSVEDIENETVRKAIENGEKVKAWYDVKTGEVHLYLPNVTDKYDAQKSVVHEVVGHKGMRNLLGESGYRDMMRRMYTHLSEEEAAEVNDRMMKNGWDFYTAMDEWVADKAEESVWTPQEYPKYIGLSNLWSRIKNSVTEAIHKAGYNINPNVDDVKYWLWESKKALQNGDAYTEMKRNSFLWKLNHGLDRVALKEVIGDSSYRGDGNILYRNSLDYHKNDTPTETATKDAIERELGSKGFRRIEAWTDDKNSVKVVQRELAKGVKNFDSSMDAYHGAINQSSVVAEKQKNFERRELRELEDEVKKATAAFGGGVEGYENANLYIYMKSGLERNRVLLVRDVADKVSAKINKFNKELREKDPKANVITFTGVDKYRDEFHAEKDYQTTLLEQGRIDLKQYYDALDKFIRDFEFEKTGDAEVDKKIDELNKWYTEKISDKYDPNDNDYSGISSIVQYRVNGQFSDAAIIDAVMKAENTIGGADEVDKLWSAIKGVTNYALETDHKYGIINSAAKDRAQSMFNWYVPMRGFKEDSMEDSYEYMRHDSGRLASSSLQTAKGRTTLAQSPLGTAAAMAERAISRGEDNANRQRMYRLVNAWLKEHTEVDDEGNAKQTEQAPVMVSDVWYEKKTDSLGNEYWEVAAPDVTPEMSAEEVRQEIEDFNSDMKAKQTQGGATKTLQKGVYAKPFENKGNKKQNIVTVWFGGKQRQIIFTGNPRAAQALNGELKSDAHQGVIMRVMGGMFTSYNPTFSISNLSRDTIFANNNIMNKESAEYYAKFTALQARLLGEQTIGMLTANAHEKVRGEYFNMWAHYKQGKVPKGDLEKLFYEFMDNGGKTGFVKTRTIDDFETEIRKNAGGRKAVEAIGKALHALPEVIEGMNERAENLNRFACYATSRRMGRSIMQSVTDAKEVSTNFNRKGLGGASFRVPGGKKMERVEGFLADWCKSKYLFFNAGIQSLRLLGSNVKHHPVRTLINTVGMPMLFGGFIIPLLNQWIAGDDGEKYASLPEWDRKNNICIYIGKNRWIKIPLPIELRGFYGLGDVARSVDDKRLQSVNGPVIDGVSELSQILPIDFMGEGVDPWAVLVPDAAKPLVQVWRNKDWTGKPIYKDYDYLKYDPEYTKVYQGEFEPFVWLSKQINELSGGTEVSKGSMDGSWNNPAIWNNIMQGYLGGAFNDAARTGKQIYRLATWNWDDFSTREIPMLRALYSTPTEKTVYYRALNKYAKYKEEADKYSHDMKKWSKNLDNPEISIKYNAEIKGNSVDKQAAALIGYWEKVFKEARKSINSGELSEAEKQSLQLQVDKAKMDVVNEIEKMQ